jgi:thiosulfate/3-mercaptopyruvate sulfurtransferase
MEAIKFMVEPSELTDELKHGAVLIDAREASAYKRGHIPGAMPLSTYDSLVTDSSLEGMRAFTEAMAQRFSSVGVTNQQPVIVYDDDTGMRAAREVWILEYMGHRQPRMLHGGIKQWIAEGGPVIDDTDITTVRPKKLRIEVNSGCFASADEVCRRAGAWNLGLIDVRNDLEWAGKDNTQCCARHGHIPHAVHIEWTHFLENGRFKSPEAIIALLAEHGINPHGDVVLYCHRGARSANTYYALRHAGLLGARNFMGSWHEWSARSDFPIKT